MLFLFFIFMERILRMLIKQEETHALSARVITWQKSAEAECGYILYCLSLMMFHIKFLSIYLFLQINYYCIMLLSISAADRYIHERFTMLSGPGKVVISHLVT